MPTTHLAAGNTADILIDGDRVIKRYKHADFAAAEREVRNQRVARTAGLSVPEVLGLAEIDGRPSVEMAYVPGATLGATIAANPAESRTILQRTVDTHLRIHAIERPALPPMADRLTRQIEHARLLSAEEKMVFIARLHDLSPEFRLCHGDFHPENLIDHDGDVTIIDWVDATSGDPLLDVCRTYLLYSMVSPGAAQFYVEAYCAQSGHDPAAILAWEPVIAAARLSEHASAKEDARLLAIVRRS